MKRRVARAVNELEPDVLVLTGDAIDRADRLDTLATFLGLLSPSAAKFAVLGNWEHWARVDVDRLRRVYSDGGVRLLINESVLYRKGEHEVRFTGVDDWTAGRPDMGGALRGALPAVRHVILAHSPVYRDVFVEALAAEPARFEGHTFNIMLSGHTHGGQVNLLGWAPVRPAGSGRYVAGWYGDGPLPLYVSRGIGTSLARIRFGAPPEVAAFDWAL